jgi:hypothetical protein
MGIINLQNVRLFRNETGQTPRSYRCNVLETPADR